MNERRTNIGIWVLLGVAVGVAALLLTNDTNDRPLDPKSVAPDGAKGIVDLVKSYGADVQLGRSIPGGQQRAILLADNYGLDDRERVSDWVRAGGVLVVADPFSPLTPALGSDGGDIGCSVPALGGVGSVAGVTRAFVAPPDGTVCFDGAVAVDPLGDGVIVSLAGPEPFLNEQLDEEDNAVLAVALLAPSPDTEVAFLESRVAFDDTGESLASLVPDAAWVIIIQLGVAFLIVAWSKSRRLGKPVPEPALVVIEGSELVDARGRLLERIRQPAAAATYLRRSAHVRLCSLMGLSSSTDSEELAAAVAQATGQDPGEVSALLGHSAVNTDAQLFALANRLGDLTDQLIAGDASSPVTSGDTQ